jgi:hypothetical protein
LYSLIAALEARVLALELHVERLEEDRPEQPTTDMREPLPPLGGEG